MNVVGAGTFPFVLPVETGIRGGVTVGGTVRVSMCVQPPGPHHGYRIEVRYDGVVCRGRRIWRTRVEATPGVIPRLLRLTVSLWTLPSPGWSLEAFFWK